MLTSQREVPLDHGVQPFYYAFFFNLLVFYWEFLHLYSSGILDFLAVSLSGFGIRVMLASSGEMFLLHQFFGRVEDLMQPYSQ